MSDVNRQFNGLKRLEGTFTVSVWDRRCRCSLKPIKTEPIKIESIKMKPPKEWQSGWFRPTPYGRELLGDLWADDE